MEKIFNTEEKKDTMSVVSTMMETKMSEISPLAIEYLKYISKIYGFCGEVMVTAFAHYCQAVLGLPCDNPEYRINFEGRQWFKENKYENIPHNEYPHWNWNENPCGNE